MQRGVSASKEDVHNAIKNIDKGVFPKAFCKIIPDILGGDPEYCNIMHADGAGTKSSLAYLYWKETGDLSVWKGIAQDALIMNIDDLLCVGAVDNILVSSTIGRNKLLVPGEVISAIINGTDELLAELREMGVGVYATGGETADVGDLVRTIIVDSTVTCRMKRSDVIDNANIRPGDVIVGLASFGQATYEKEYNGGMGSNGLTSARHDVFAKYLAEKFLCKVLCKHIVTGTGKTVTSHSSVVLLLVSCLTERCKTHDHVARTDIRVVDNIAALHTASHSRVNDDSTDEVSHIRSLATCRINAYAHLAEFSEKFVCSVDDCADHLTRNKELVTTDSRRYEDIVHSTHAKKVIDVHDEGILSNAFPHAQVSCFLPVKICER